MIMSGLSAWTGSGAISIPALKGRNLYLGNMALVDGAIVQTLAAYAVVVGLVNCHRSGLSFKPAEPGRCYLSNVFLMMGITESDTGDLKPEEMKILQKLWILSADHELTNSTSALLHAASSLTDPVSCVISAIASGYGPLHFGAAEGAYRLMQRIGTP